MAPRKSSGGQSALPDCVRRGCAEYTLSPSIWLQKKRGKGVAHSCRAAIKTAFRMEGQVAEWSIAHAWKACLGESLTRVRIPLCPPSHEKGPAWGLFHEMLRGFEPLVTKKRVRKPERLRRAGFGGAKRSQSLSVRPRFRPSSALIPHPNALSTKSICRSRSISIVEVISSVSST